MGCPSHAAHRLLASRPRHHWPALHPPPPTCTCTCTPSTPLTPPPPPIKQEDFMKAVRKMGEAKKLEGNLAYSSEWDKSGA